MPALRNRFDPEATCWRFDLLTDVTGLDRERVRAWTLARVLENCLWDVEDGEDELDEVQLSIARNLLARQASGRAGCLHDSYRRACRCP